MRKLLTLSALLLLSSAAHAQNFVAQQFYGGPAGGISALPISYTVQNAGNLLLLFAANDSPIGVSDTNNTWSLLQAPNGGYTALYVATAKASGTFQVTVQYSPNSSYAAVLFAEYAAKLDQSLGIVATGSVIAAGLANPNNEMVAEFGNIYGKWADYTSTSGQTMRANSGAHQGIFLAEGTGQSGTVPFNQWGTGIVAVSLLPLIPVAPPPQSVNLSLSGTLLWDDGTPIQGKVQVQEQRAPDTVWYVLKDLIPDGSGNVSATVSISTNFADNLQFLFIILDATGKVTQGVLEEPAAGGMFQKIRSVSGFKIIVDKASCAGTQCVLAPGSMPGTFGP